ncbi:MULTISPECIES: hypothetical protein [Ponticoccus]|uniref:DUF4239 domain-containing protein n=1 Tax=Ponticoccus litoralis TaxID=422297 RepID=A0AAW9SNF5_9RHOB
MITVAIALTFVGGTLLLAWVVYFAMRRIAGDRTTDETQTLAGSVIIRVASLHGLILALVFAQELVDYHDLQDNLVQEATAIADIYNDIWRYDPRVADAVQADLRRYTHTVIEDEWQALARDQRLSGEGWALRESIYLAVLDLEPATARQQSLRSHMVTQVQQIATLRQARENTALHAVSPLFWVAAVAGVVLVTVPYFTYAPSGLHLMLLSVYGTFSGLVMFTIFAFADPFRSPGALEPAPFERLLETEIGGG